MTKLLFYLNNYFKHVPVNFGDFAKYLKIHEVIVLLMLMFSYYSIHSLGQIG